MKITIKLTTIWENMFGSLFPFASGTESQIQVGVVLQVLKLLEPSERFDSFLCPSSHKHGSAKKKKVPQIVGPFQIQQLSTSMINYIRWLLLDLESKNNNY